MMGEILRSTLRRAGSERAFVYYPVKVGLGSVVASCDDTAAVVRRFKYAAFGKPLVLTPSYTPLQSSGFSEGDFRFLFTGREWLANVELSGHRNRYYMPLYGRWISPDPVGIKGGLNLYAYVENMPTMLTDSQGLDPIIDKILDSLKGHQREIAAFCMSKLKCKTKDGCKNCCGSGGIAATGVSTIQHVVGRLACAELINPIKIGLCEIAQTDIFATALRSINEEDQSCRAACDNNGSLN